MKKQHYTDEIPRFLQDLKEKGEGYKVPEGYFEQMEDAVFARLRATGDLDRTKMKVVKRPGLFTSFIRPRAALAYAAAMALVLAAVWFFRQPSELLQVSPLVSTELTEDDLEFYVLENVHEFEPEQLASLQVEDKLEQAAENPAATPGQKLPAAEDLHPDDLDNILDEMTDEELEQIL